MPEIKFEGIAELEKAIAEKIKLEDMKRIVKQNGAELQEKAMQNAQFKGHYEGKKFVKPTGNLKRSISLENSADGLTATVEPKAEYSAYVELGTRFMNAQPYLKPAFEAQKKQFQKDLDELVK